MIWNKLILILHKALFCTLSTDKTKQKQKIKKNKASVKQTTFENSPRSGYKKKARHSPSVAVLWIGNVHMCSSLG